MSNYGKKYSENFKKDLRKIKTDFLLRERVVGKIAEIIENPHHYKPLRNMLKNRRRVHLGSFVLIFEVDDKEELVTFHALRHHDEAYK
ncbi:MAG: type II toxin-antitoxin system RelE/ParE family toxin [Deltaproteobacteria bacterium]|nr:type II toxin-antitoxin system RelE/ParE family toxin [Deltaproteobacteria bacterium]